MYFNQRTGKKDRFSRIVKMHADKREEIDAAEAGDIVAIMGLDCASGDTYAAEPKYCTLESMFVAEPVIKMSINPLTRDGVDKLSKALQRFRKEDPTFRVFTDEETSETVIAGMGELHLEIYVERIRREYKVEVEVGAPKVSYREAPTVPTQFNHKHKKQTGGSGQYGSHHRQDGAADRRRACRSRAANCCSSTRSSGGRIPKNFIPAIEKGFRTCWPRARSPASRWSTSSSSSRTARTTTSTARTWRSMLHRAGAASARTFPKMKPALLEPIMMVEIECPESFQGSVVGNIISRRGIDHQHRDEGQDVQDHRRSAAGRDVRLLDRPALMTQGQGTFTMELSKYRPVPRNIQTEIIAERKAELQPA